MRKTLLLIISIWFSSIYISYGQSLINDSVMNATIIYATYSLQIPKGDLDERFGLNSSIGAGLKFKMNKNWLFAMEGNFMFGDDIKENSILSSVLGPNEQLFDAEGNLEEVFINERGFYLGMEVGKVIPKLSPNPNSGWMINLKGGFLQHKIKIDADFENVPQLSKEMIKGYDRLSNGFMLSQFFGYQYMDPNKFINVFAGIEITEAFTQNRRSWNYDLNQVDNQARKDILVGFKIGWMIPIYKKSTEKYYYY